MAKAAAEKKRKQRIGVKKLGDLNPELLQRATLAFRIADVDANGSISFPEFFQKLHGCLPSIDNVDQVRKCRELFKFWGMLFPPRPPFFATNVVPVPLCCVQPLRRVSAARRVRGAAGLPPARQHPVEGQQRGRRLRARGSARASPTPGSWSECGGWDTRRAQTPPRIRHEARASTATRAAPRLC